MLDLQLIFQSSLRIVRDPIVPAPQPYAAARLIWRDDSAELRAICAL